MYLLDLRIVFALPLQAFTRPFAVANVIFQTNLEFFSLNIRLRQRQLARADLVQCLKHIQQRVHRAQIGERTIKSTFGTVHIPRRKYARERLVGNADERVGLIVFEKDIEFRLQLFDQLVFKQQRIPFAQNDGVFDPADLAHEPSRFTVVLVVF
ncbi:hypothetical protein D3C87_1637300 [compost metagenome]